MRMMISCHGDARPMIAAKVIMKVAAANSESNEGRHAIGHRLGSVFTLFHCREDERRIRQQY
jgi:hypothetical protein